MSMDLDLQKLTEAIQELSKQFEASNKSGQKETEKLMEYQNEGTMIEFTLVTGGVIKGKITWLDDQSIGINTANIEGKQNIILYKHTIAFIQEKPSQK